MIVSFEIDIVRTSKKKFPLRYADKGNVHKIKMVARQSTNIVIQSHIVGDGTVIRCHTEYLAPCGLFGCNLILCKRLSNKIQHVGSIEKLMGLWCASHLFLIYDRRILDRSFDDHTLFAVGIVRNEFACLVVAKR